MSTAIARKRFTVADYYRMAETGIIRRDDRVELLDGEIRVTSPIGSWHAGVVNRLAALLMQRLGSSAVVAVQNPVRLGQFDEPEPDIAVLRARNDFYAESHPTPSDVLLIIEVADSSIDYDRDEKLPRYASVGVAEVWLIDLNEEAVEQFREPKDGRYQTVKSFTAAERFGPLLLPTIEVSASELLA